ALPTRPSSESLLSASISQDPQFDPHIRLHFVRNDIYLRYRNPNIDDNGGISTEAACPKRSGPPPCWKHVDGPHPHAGESQHGSYPDLTRSTPCDRGPRAAKVPPVRRPSPLVVARVDELIAKLDAALCDDESAIGPATSSYDHIVAEWNRFKQFVDELD